MNIARGSIFKLGIGAIVVGLVATNIVTARAGSRDRAVGDSLKLVTADLTASSERMVLASNVLRDSLRLAMDTLLPQALASRGEAEAAGDRVDEGIDALDGLTEGREMVPADSVRLVAAELREDHAEERERWRNSDRLKDNAIAKLTAQVLQDSVTIDSLVIARDAEAALASHWEESFNRQTRWDLGLISLPKWTKDVALVVGGVVIGRELLGGGG